MLKNNSPSLFEENRQSPVAIFIIVQRLIIALLKGFWPFLLLFLFNKKDNSDSTYFWIGIALLSISSVSSIVQYFTYFFSVKDKELHIRSGLFNKKLTNIPFERIQTINFTQNLIHRIFNVVQVEIDTAGSNTNELTLSALNQQQAQQLRDYILENKKTITPTYTEVQEGDTSTASDELQEDKILLHLKVKDLLKIGVSQNHLRTVGIILFFVLGLSNNIRDLFDINLEEEIWLRISASLFILITVTLALFFIAFLFTLVNTVLKHYDLKFIQQARGFKIVSGLFTKTEQAAKYRKIQLVNWDTNPIKRLFKLYTLHLKQAGSSMTKAKHLKIPGSYQQQIDTVREVYFPNYKEDDFDFQHISPLIIGRYTLYFGVMPALVFTLIKIPQTWWALLILAWIPLVQLFTVWYHSKFIYGKSTRGLYLKKGVFGEEAGILAWEKVQAISLHQSPFQRRKKLANIQFYTAAGKVKIPYIPLNIAQELRNFVLYKVEIDSDKWM